MSRDTLEILNSKGHLELTWDPDDAAELAKAREEVARLKAAGYSFFTVQNTPADEVAAGTGKLIVQRIDDPTEVPKRPGRPRREPQRDEATPAEAPAEEGNRTVAARPLRGG